MGRRRATNDEWQEYYERADRVRSRFGDPFERHIASVRLRNTIFNVCVCVLGLGLSAAFTVCVLEFFGGR